MVTAMEKTLLDCEQYIEEAMAEHATAQCPPLLAQALNYAVFPGGARVRPQLCKAVALANNSSDVGLANAAATAVELLHCASLVHDDLPCFDDATQRRGKPSVHSKFGERIAVLTGDALIVAAFQTLSAHAVQAVRAAGSHAMRASRTPTSVMCAWPAGQRSASSSGMRHTRPPPV